MGFMAGFGSAFSKSYENAADNRAVKEEDTFKLMYSDYIQRRGDREKYNREQAKNVNAAKSYAEAYGANSSAWPKIKEWIDAGMTDTQIAQNIQNGDFITGPTPPASIAADNAPADASTSNQTKASGLAPDTIAPVPGAEGASVTPAGATPPISGGSGDATVAGGDTPGFGWHKPDPAAKARSRIAQTAGVDEATVTDTLNKDLTTPTQAGGNTIQYRPKHNALKDITKLDSVEGVQAALDLATAQGNESDVQLYTDMLKGQQAVRSKKINDDARARAEAEGTAYHPQQFTTWDDKGNFVKMVDVTPDGQGGFQDADGNPIEQSTTMHQVTKTEADDWDKVVKDSVQPVTDYQKKVSDFVTTAKLADEMKSLIDPTKGGNPAVLSIAGDISQIGTNILADIKGVAGLSSDNGNLVLDANNDGFISGSEVDAINSIADKAQKVLSSGTVQNMNVMSVQRGLLEAKALKMAYLQAASFGQTGQGVSKVELQNIYQSILQENPTSFLANLDGNMMSQKSDLDTNYQMLTQNNLEIQNYEARWHYQPFPIARPVDEQLAGLGIGQGDPSANAAKEKQMTGIPKVTDDAEGDKIYEALPEGGSFLDPEGNTRQKPRKTQ